jgi:ABC-2 type transport system permease protein
MSGASPYRCSAEGVLTRRPDIGFRLPLAIVPEWFRTMGHFTQNAWAMDGFQGILWYGKGRGGIWLEIAVLAGIAAATGAAAWIGWRRRFERRA